MVERREGGAPVGAVERFDPGLMHGQLLEAEHLARYGWAASIVSGKRVLDAGCGTAYGSNLLAEAGAAEVVGVDIDSDTLEAARGSAHAAVTLATADVRALPDGLGDFDLVVCFEVIEHLDDPQNVFDELGRVLRPDGVLAVSSPNRDVYPPGNPHHKHEFRPDELAEALARRFPHVRLVRQQDWLASAVFEDDEFVQLEPVQAPVQKAVAGEPGAELYSLALAGRSALPSTPPFVVLTHTADVKWWQELLQELRNELEATRDHASELADELRAVSSAYAELEGVIASMQATRVWRLGTRYWGLRDRLLGRARRRG